MKKLQYQQEIKAPAERVYITMLGLVSKTTYELWTAEFNPTSTYEGTWEQGSKMYFVGTDTDGKKGGMVSEIAALVPNSFVSIRHIGMLDGDTEITEGPLVEAWAGSLENYTLEEQDGITTVTVTVNSAEAYADYFEETWPRALQKLKAVVEVGR